MSMLTQQSIVLCWLYNFSLVWTRSHYLSLPVTQWGPELCHIYICVYIYMFIYIPSVQSCVISVVNSSDPTFDPACSHNRCVSVGIWPHIQCQLDPTYHARRSLIEVARCTLCWMCCSGWRLPTESVTYVNVQTNGALTTLHWLQVQLFRAQLTFTQLLHTNYPAESLYHYIVIIYCHK